MLCCYYDYTQIKVDPLQFQTIPYSYLYDQKLQSILVIFTVIKKMRDRPHRCGLRPQWVNMGADINTYEMSVSNISSVSSRGVTVHKIHGSVRYDTVVSRFGMFSIRGRGNWLYVAMLEIFLF